MQGLVQIQPPGAKVRQSALGDGTQHTLEVHGRIMTATLAVAGTHLLA